MTNWIACAGRSRQVSALAYPACAGTSDACPTHAAGAAELQAGYRGRGCSTLRTLTSSWCAARYDGWGYSPLKQITPANVARLKPVWSFATGNTSGSRGDTAREQRRDVRRDAWQPGAGDRCNRRACCSGAISIRRHQTSSISTARAAASRFLGNKVFFARSEAVLVALDAKTGKELGPPVEKNRNGYYIPWSARGRRQVIVGTSGGELACAVSSRRSIRKPARQLWKVFTIPAPGEPAAKRGRLVATSGRPAAVPSGSRPTTIPQPSSPASAPAMAARGWATAVLATTSTPRRPSPST